MVVAPDQSGGILLGATEQFVVVPSTRKYLLV
jgi:hypothetical protein